MPSVMALAWQSKRMHLEKGLKVQKAQTNRCLLTTGHLGGVAWRKRHRLRRIG